MLQAQPLRPLLGVHRVYLLGGASSTGTAKDTVVIYTPALIDEGIYIANLTVPEGLFWSDIINPPGKPQRDNPLLSWLLHGVMMFMPWEGIHVVRLQRGCRSSRLSKTTISKAQTYHKERLQSLFPMR